jgi:3-methyladenine DNA glycosylase AlkD
LMKTPVFVKKSVNGLLRQAGVRAGRRV